MENNEINNKEYFCGLEMDISLGIIKSIYNIEIQR